jgi:hypothetical protein
VLATDVLGDELSDALSAKPPGDVANLRLNRRGAGVWIAGSARHDVLELIQVRL